jgi:glycosyltransferase involved in cell wall biosynthesis
LRVLQVHNKYRQRGGEDGVVASEAELLRRHGHVVLEHFASNPEGASAAATLALAPWNPSSSRSMRNTLRDNPPDVAHVHNTWFTLTPSVLGALRQAKVPVVMTLHNYRLVCVNALVFRDGKPCQDCVGHSPLPGIRHRCYRDSTVQSAAAAATISFNRARRTWVNAVDLFIAPSRVLRDTLVAGGLPADRFVIRPHAVADAGPRTGAPSSSSTVLYVGRVSQEKGIDVLLDAWERARPRDLELVVVGDGPEREALERRGVDGVRFTGWLSKDEVRALMLAARAFVFPSVCFESFGLTIVEAMSAGLPVIASAHGSAAEIVGEIGPEWLAAPGRADDWAARLAILDDAAALDVAGKRAREIYESQYAQERGISSLLDAYQTAIDAGVSESGRRR